MPTKLINRMSAGTNPERAKPEVELLLCCARTSMDSANAQRITSLIGPGLNWDYLLQIAQQHDLLPLLYRHLRTITADGVPPAVREHLRVHFYSNTYHILWRAEELRKLMHLFESQGIAALAFKGPTVAATAYRDLTCRPFLDLDILIQKRDLIRAKELLVSQGYQAHKHLTKAQEYIRLHYSNCYSFSRDSGRSQVELHWALFDRHIGFKMEFERLWQRRVLTNLADAEIPTLAPEDLPLILCIHGTKHCWHKIKWICDIAELLRVYQEMDWSPVMSEARALGFERMLYLGLFLAHDLLDAPLPSGIKHDVASDPIVRTLTVQVRQSLHRDGGMYRSPVQNHLFQVRTRQHLLQKSRYGFRFLQFRFLQIVTTPSATR